MELRQKAQGVLYAVTNNEPVFLILRRSEAEGGYWQPLTGSVEANESELECLRRELTEEVGLEPADATFSEVIYTFDWSQDGVHYDEFVRGIEISPQASIILSEEHMEYKWCVFDEAMSLLRHESNKYGFQQIQELYSQKD
jgi:8-oxo-dGTP pyrophosphatase MutT (NUDIX family)